MDDLISRQELLNDVEELRQSPWFNDDNYFAIRKDALSCVVDLCIKKAPSAQQWISCSEKLPEEDGIYLTTVMAIGLGIEGLTIANFSAEKGWDFKLHEVLAWMPLPEPYKGDNK